MDELAWFDEFQRQTTSAENAVRFQDAFGDIDVRRPLGAVRAPTLVLHAKHDQRITLDQGRELAIHISNARFVALESRSHIILGHEGDAGSGQRARSTAGQSEWRRALVRAGKGTAPLRAAIAGNAERHTRDLAPVVEDIRAGGQTSLGAIAEELNARGMLTRRGGRWHKSTVINLLERLGRRTAGVAAGGRLIGECQVSGAHQPWSRGLPRKRAGFSTIRANLCYDSVIRQAALSWKPTYSPDADCVQLQAARHKVGPMRMVALAVFPASSLLFPPKPRTSAGSRVRRTYRRAGVSASTPRASSRSSGATAFSFRAA